MARITIEGSVTPSTFLSRGKRTTTERTPFINKLIRKGFVIVVDEPDKVVEITRETEAVHTAARQELSMTKEDNGAPPRNASTEEWAAFLERKEIAFADGSTRADLIARWDHVTGRDTDE